MKHQREQDPKNVQVTRIKHYCGRERLRDTSNRYNTASVSFKAQVNTCVRSLSFVWESLGLNTQYVKPKEMA